MDAIDLLTSTRSVRRTLDLAAPVDLNDVRECLRVALQAPNGTNEQPWRWIVVTDADLRQEVAALYRDAYLSMTGGTLISEMLEGTSDFDRMMSSTEWLVTHLAQVPVLVIPCYQPYLPDFEGDESSFQSATMYGSIFPAVWSFQLALHERGYGTCITTMHLHHEDEVRVLLGIPDTHVQGCLLPVGRLRSGTRFTPAPRKPVEDVIALDGWDGPSF